MVYQVEGDYHLPLTEDIFEDDSELLKKLKKVMGVIVGLLKDQVTVDGSPVTKKARME